MLVCETKDFVEIGIKADVFYRIGDAAKVLLVVGKVNRKFLENSYKLLIFYLFFIYLLLFLFCFFS